MILAQQAHALVLALGLVLVVGLAGGQVVPTALTPLGLASAVGSGALYYAGAYWFYLGALRHVPASYAAVSFYLIPIVGVAAGALLLGERLDPRQWVGAVIVLAAILAILRQPSAARAGVGGDGIGLRRRPDHAGPLSRPAASSSPGPAAAGTAAGRPGMFENGRTSGWSSMPRASAMNAPARLDPRPRLRVSRRERGAQRRVGERDAVLDVGREVVGPGRRDDVDLERHPGPELDRRAARDRRVDPLVELDLVARVEEDPEERVAEVPVDDLVERAAGLPDPQGARTTRRPPRSTAPTSRST